jgi:hypothetical protein
MVTNVDMPAVDPKLVVNAYLSPDDSMINVAVTHSFPVGKPMVDFAIEDAVVTLYANDSSIIIPYNPDKWTYSLDISEFPLQAGQTYDITVSASGYKSVDATTTIPQYACTDVTYLGMTRSWDPDFEGWVEKYKFRMKDIPGQKNFYYAKLSFPDPFDSTYSMELWADEDYGLASDEDHDGGDIYYNFSYYNYNDIPGKKATLYLLTTDENYYLFHKSYWNYTGDDPFTEPVLMHSNVANGLGAVASFRTFVQEYTLSD